MMNIGEEKKEVEFEPLEDEEAPTPVPDKERELQPA